MRRVSIGVKLMAWYAGLLAAALAIFGFLAVWELKRAVLASADAELEQAAMGVETTIRESAPHGDAELHEELDEYAVALRPAIALDVRRDGAPLVQSGAPVRDARSFFKPLNLSGRRFEIRATVSIASGLAMVSTFSRALTALAPMLLLFAGAAGYWISRRALRPVDEITREARAIGLENLSRRLRVPHSGDELSRLAEAWNEMLARLEGSVSRLSRFTADASHEMRSPVAVIRATAELALRRPRPEAEYRFALEETGRQANRLAALIEDLLALARAEEEADPSFSSVDLGAAARSACEQLEPVAREKSVLVTAEVRAGSAVIRGHERSIQRLITILLDNAVKFSPVGGRVGLCVEPCGEVRIALTVEDGGPGIAPADLPHIFERFYRADPVRTPGANGTGLGLALAQSIAQSHGADIEAASKEGGGSVFRVTFPMAEKDS